MAKHSLSRTWPTTVPIDGAPITLQFTRMSVDEFVTWERRYLSYRETGAETDEVARAAELLEFVKETLTTCVTLPEDELDVDGSPVRTGADLFGHFGTRMQLMAGLLNRVWLFHRFEDRARKNLLSLSDSPATSVEPATEVVGPRPDPTAGNVENAGSATTEAVDPAVDLTALPSGATV